MNLKALIPRESNRIIFLFSFKTFKNAEDDITADGRFPDGVRSIKVFQNTSWEVFSEPSYGGEKATLQPGNYSRPQEIFESPKAVMSFRPV